MLVTCGGIGLRSVWSRLYFKSSPVCCVELVFDTLSPDAFFVDTEDIELISQKAGWLASMERKEEADAIYRESLSRCKHVSTFAGL